ncbi:hypothetical protein P691DRAFT_812308 [Macrolepiota fuliginosa MF-IS2]|uniref:Uncharacterized protein n=1 Tax=Macrolepiota fuliginosa MF-IS2 TaxID=1400762 RepID=A0A9P5WZW1_9AGAR|nr:hypothetical protein P691DRAFT_812308 [Macrolepiota fuliginosa MF-IS2]
MTPLSYCHLKILCPPGSYVEATARSHPYLKASSRVHPILKMSLINVSFGKPNMRSTLTWYAISK